ncbi:hypothetical protein [Bosea sp. LjRoot237]|uniref:hypothetical protein n=1 Tax=Bosea sp. LjRoot237 TaxID=3342292 RepID=UPI003ECEAA7A
MSTPAYRTLEEVVARYRGQVSEGTLRNWRAMRISLSFIKIGKAAPGGASSGRVSSITLPGCSRHEQCEMIRFTMRNP